MEHRLFPAFVGLAFAGLALLIAGDLIPATPQPQVLRTRAIEIVDSRGQARITLDAFGGKPAVWLYDGKRRRRIGVTIGAGDIPEVALIDDAGRARLLLRVGAERAVEMRLTDDLGRPRMRLSVDYLGDPGFWMYDGLVRERIGLKVSAGRPRLWLFDDPSGRLSFTAP
jgi:hypothetical protein